MTSRGAPRRLAALAVILTATLGATAASAQATSTLGSRTISLADAVATALRQNPDAQNSEAAVRGAEADRGVVAGNYGPKLHVDANVQQWNSPFDINFGGLAFQVRNAFTWTASVTLTQPLSGLWTIYDQYQVGNLGVDVAAIQRQVTRREVAFQVAQAYYRLLEAERLAEVAKTSVSQLEAQQRESQSLFDNGVIGKNDLLRAGLALASSKQREIQMRGNVVLARGQLVTLMGEPLGADVEAEPFTGEPGAIDEPSVASAETRAAAQRLEVRALDRTIDQADHGVAAAKKKLIPQVNAVGNYTHFEGSQFQQENAAFAGLFASWDVWDWGTTTNGISSANAKLDQARIARKKLEDQVRLEARQAFVNAQTAREALAVARTAVSQAEENFRIVTKKFENAAATSFDVVDAEALLTQARGQVETGLYDLLIARAALARATGTALPGER
ncbi:MAG TPA: TolC family protein [Polyangiaceae bacterium]|jgi:outer membrane protein TolC